MIGLPIIGHSSYGIFPLKGKLMNVRSKTGQEVMRNEEIRCLLNIIGLSIDNPEPGINLLRYKSIIIMSDMDVDGHHISGLIVNFFHTYWPSLLRINGFIQRFRTPLVRVYSNNEVIYQSYDDTIPPNLLNQPNYNIKYYKGLGSSSSTEAKEYFQNLDEYLISYIHTSKTDDIISNLFSNNSSDFKKLFLTTHNETSSLIEHSYEYFFYTDFMKYCEETNKRSFTNYIDGLKPSYRRVLSTLLNNNLGQIKIARLQGFVAQYTDYHHGEDVLSDIIIKMNQSYVGSNNIPLLLPSGQVGTRHMRGTDAASPRYIYTELSPITKLIYPDIIHQGGSYLIPIIPMVLINGTEGIGFGYSSFIPNYNPKQIIQILLQLLDGNKEIKDDELVPYYNNFKGTIIPIYKKNRRTCQTTFEGYCVSGVINKINDDNQYRITEIPFTISTEKFYNKLLSYKIPIEQNHSEDTVDFTIYVDNEKQLNSIKKDLTSTISIENINCYDENGVLCSLTPLEIIHKFYTIRLQCYEERKCMQVAKLQEQQKLMEEKIQLLHKIINKEIDIMDILDSNIQLSELKEGAIRSKEIELNNIIEELKSIRNKSIEDIWKEELTDLMNYL